MLICTPQHPPAQAALQLLQWHAVDHGQLSMCSSCSCTEQWWTGGSCICLHTLPTFIAQATHATHLCTYSSSWQADCAALNPCWPNSYPAAAQMTVLAAPLT
jgi:hypothetical protein